MKKRLFRRISVLYFTIICDMIRTSNEIRFSLHSYISRLNDHQKVSNPCLITLWTAGREALPEEQKIIHIKALLLMLKALTGDDRYETMIEEMLETEHVRGEVTMCELLDKYEARGITQGITQEITQGITNGRIEDIKNLMETMQWSAEQAMLALKISDGDKKKYLARL